VRKGGAIGVQRGSRAVIALHGGLMLHLRVGGCALLRVCAWWWQWSSVTHSVACVCQERVIEVGMRVSSVVEDGCVRVR
jgi:hypothetical protein